MSDNRGVLILGEDAVLKGEVKNCKRMELYGYAEGQTSAESLLIHQGGRLYGNIQADNLEVEGTLQGDVRVKQLMRIKSTGSVTGNIKYGRLAMEEGAEMTAHVRNVPPAISGDLDLAVSKGKWVRITLADISAVDPDDKPEDLLFAVSNAINGYVAYAGAPAIPVSAFTQADLEQGRVVFAHDGSESTTANFDIAVTDKSGASSGAPKTVNVAIRPT